MRRFLPLAFVIVLILGCAAPWNDLHPSLPDINGKPNGIYRGEYSVERTPVSVTLEVTLNNGRLTHINILQHNSSPVGRKAERITDRIIEKQSLDVDVISGATVSSKGILMAVENALR